MTKSQRLGPIVAACCLLGGATMGTGPLRSPAHADTLAQPFGPCERAGIAAERASGLPPGLLLAIGRVESGKWDPARSRVIPWPWAINAVGKGQWPDAQDTAVATVRRLLDGGTRSIDVGCFQINLFYHPAAFPTLEQAFDPDTNARYAARFLLSLFGRTGTWEVVVAAYHSADPMLGFVYRQQVFSTWAAAPPPPTAAIAALDPPEPRVKPRPMPEVIAGVQVWSALPAGTGAMTVAMPPPVGWEAPRTTLTAAPMPPLPVVSYRVMPRL